MVLGFRRYGWVNGSGVYQDGKPRGLEQVQGGRRMEGLRWPWVNLSHMYNCHACGQAGGLEVQVEAQARDTHLGVISRAAG